MNPKPKEEPKDKKLPKTTAGGENRAEGEDLDAVAIDTGGRAGIGEGGVVEAGERVTPETTDEGKALEEDQEKEWQRESGEG